MEIPLEKISSSRTTSHDLSFRWNKKPNDMENVSDTPYEVTVLHTNGLPTLVSQQLQICYNLERDLWSTCSRDHIYSYPSANPPYFRAVCEIAHYKNIQGRITFLFQLLDGTTVTQIGAGAAPTDSNGDIWTITSNSFRSSSPVIGVSVLFEVDWDKVNDFLEYNAPKLPNDSPSRDITDEVFTETVVIPSREHNIQFSQLPEKLPEISTPDMPSREDLWKQIQALQDKIEAIYERDGGQAGFYIIDIGPVGTGQFMPALDMINGLDTGYIPQGDTGTTTMTRPLTPQQLDGELGRGEWSRYAFTEPGDPGSGEATGMEVYTQSVTTESGVQASITIATDGSTTVEFVTAQGTGTGTNPYTLPDSGTYPSGGTSSGGVGGFSFTTFESDGMSVFSNVCGDVTTGSNTIKDITAAVTGAEATGLFKPLEQGLGAYSFTKDMMDGVSNEITLMDLLNAPNKWLSSPCAQKLTPQFRTNMQNQINNFIKDVRDAEGWNMAVTGANYVLGAGGLVGMFSNPWTGIIGGAAAWCAGKISGMKLDNVQKQAAVLKDTIDLQITATAIRNNDRECMPKYNGADPANRGAGSGYGTGSGRGGSTAPYRVCIDPSGVVYEAVLSNPVKDATVTLYTDGTGFVPEYSTDDNGIPIMVNNGAPATPTNGYSGSGTLTTPVDSTIPAENVLTTGADGRFQWMVEQGLWYVTAYKDGYQPGDSGNDVAAVVSDSNGRRWLPVSPEQTNVNIPLVSYEAPTVKVEAREDGVYLTFSKYMNENTLTADGAFQINGTDATVTLLNSEKAPSNINYGQGSAPSYTSQVKLAVAEGTPLSGEITVAIADTVVSYASVPCGSRTVSGTVSNAPLVDAPAVNGASSGQVESGTAITLTIPDGAAVYYTTDGSEPSETNGIRYYANQPIVITKAMTLKAVAVKYGVRSEMVPATFTVSGTGGDIPGGDDTPTTPVTPVTPGGGSTGGSEDSSYSISVPATSAIRGGSITVSPRRADKGDTVTITVTPDDGYELDTLTVTDSKGSELTLTNKGNGRYTFTMPGSSVKIQVSFREAAAQAVNPFTDVSTGAYYYDAVLWAVANGVTNGTTATTFSPDATVTRAQMVTFLWRAHGAPRADGANPFTDVSAGAYYYDAVLWAVANGITNGTTATTSPSSGGRRAPRSSLETALTMWRQTPTMPAPSPGRWPTGSRMAPAATNSVPR